MFLQFDVAVERDAATDNLQFIRARECAGERHRSLIFLDGMGENDVFVLVQELHRAALKALIEGEDVAVEVDHGDEDGGFW